MSCYILMPYTRRKSSTRRKKSGKKRVYRRRTARQRKFNTKSTISTISTFPKEMKNVFLYHDNGSLTPSALGSANKKYRLASPYDPDVSVGGTMALYFDDLCKDRLYQKYLVTGAKVTVVLQNTGSTPQTIQLVYGRNGGYNVATNPGDVDLMTSQKNNWSAVLGAVDSARSQKRYSFWVSIPAIKGISKKQYLSDQDNNIDYNGLPDPSNDVHLVVNTVGGIAGSGNPSTNEIVYNVKIKYYVRLRQLSLYEYQA